MTVSIIDSHGFVDCSVLRSAPRTRRPVTVRVSPSASWTRSATSSLHTVLNAAASAGCARGLQSGPPARSPTARVLAGKVARMTSGSGQPSSATDDSRLEVYRAVRAHELTLNEARAALARRSKRDLRGAAAQPQGPQRGRRPLQRQAASVDRRPAAAD